MKDRIKQFMDHKGISAGELATTLEVQRSNISHILNGRNKPGAAFIEKLLLTYPNLNARWLLTGEGNMMDSGEQKVIVTDTSPKKDNVKSEMVRPAESFLNENKQVDKIILLMSDGTFIDYRKK